MPFYDDFSPEKLREQVKTQTFKLSPKKDELNVHYLAFKAQIEEANTPVILLSGAFQSFSSFEVEVKNLTRTHPVIIVEMPSQGMNTQLVENFSLDDYAKLLHLFVLHNRLNKINLIGLSYGSAMALIYAAQYPDYSERLILSGITCFKRADIMPLLQDSLDLLAAEDMDAYASLALCNLINHNHLEKTGITRGYRRLLYRQIKSLSSNQRKMHIANTKRLMDFSGFQSYPSCPTLVIAGEFDNFTQPDEQAATATQCANAQFAIIHNADHLVQLEQVEPMAQLGCAFFNEQPLEDVTGTSLFSPKHYPFKKEQISPLKRGLNIQAKLIQGNGEQHEVDIKELNISQFKIPFKANFPISKNKKNLEIKELNLCFSVHLLDKTEGLEETEDAEKTEGEQIITGIFSHQDMKATNALLKLLSELN